MNFCHCQEAVSAYSLCSSSLSFSFYDISYFVSIYFLFCNFLLFFFSSHFLTYTQKTWCVFSGGNFTLVVMMFEYERQSFAVAIVIASLAGPQWLLTEEKIPNPNYNGTINYNAIDDGMYVIKTTKSSLWILCFAQGNFHIFLHFNTIFFFASLFRVNFINFIQL